VGYPKKFNVQLCQKVPDEKDALFGLDTQITTPTDFGAD
jgi:hypothetical protein